MNGKVVRFVWVGALNTGFGYAVFAALTKAGVRDVLAAPVAMAVGVLFNFLSYGTLVFASLGKRRLPRFAAGYFLICACNVLGLRVLKQCGLDAYGAQAVLVLPLAGVAYFLNDRWVFRAAPAR